MTQLSFYPWAFGQEYLTPLQTFTFPIASQPNIKTRGKVFYPGGIDLSQDQVGKSPSVKRSLPDSLTSSFVNFGIGSGLPCPRRYEAYDGDKLYLLIVAGDAFCSSRCF